MEAETVVHLLTGQSGQEYTSGCGLVYKSKTKPVELSAWSGALTCPLCTTRLFVVHRKITSWEDLLILCNLDDTTVAKPFHFGGLRFRFRWLIGKPLIYVYDFPHSIAASGAFGIEYGNEMTYENAQERARRHVQSLIGKFDKEFVLESYKPGTALVRKASQPVQRAIPSGPHCRLCLKVDEGDLMFDPSDITQQLCMPCLVKTSR